MENKEILDTENTRYNRRIDYILYKNLELKWLRNKDIQLSYHNLIVYEVKGKLKIIYKRRWNMNKFNDKDVYHKYREILNNILNENEFDNMKINEIWKEIIDKIEKVSMKSIGLIENVDKLELIIEHRIEL